MTKIDICTTTDGFDYVIIRSNGFLDVYGTDTCLVVNGEDTLYYVKSYIDTYIETLVIHMLAIKWLA